MDSGLATSRVYQNLSGTWTQIGTDIDGEAATDESGYSVSLSGDGSVLAIGAHMNDGNGSNSGHVRVFQNVSGTWTQIGGDIDGESADDRSGNAVSLSEDGSIIAIGSGLNDGGASSSGHVRIFQNVSGTWTQVGSDIDGENTGDWFGVSVSLSADGNTVAIGANRSDGNGDSSGHVRIFQNVSGTWTQVGSDIVGAAEGDTFGGSVSLSADGTSVAIGASGNDGNGSNSGHVRVYQFESSITSGTGTITNDDSAVLNLNDISGSEDGGSLTFTASLTNPVDRAVTAVVNTGDGTATTSGRDYWALDPETITFASGELTTTVQVTLRDDSLLEPDETLHLLLSNLGAGGHAVTLGSDGLGTILDDDSELSIGNATAAEGTGGTTYMDFIVTRDGDATGSASATFTVAGTGTNPAEAADFAGGTFPTGTVDFAGGETSQTITIAVTGDNTFEPDETFVVTLSDPTGTIIADQYGYGTITNDDTTLSIGDASATEGTGGTTDVVFTVTRSGGTTGSASANFTVAGTGANPTIATDFEGGTFPTGSVNFASGESTQTISIALDADNIVELSENFTITLSSATNASIAGGIGIGTIADDDSATIRIADASVTEGDAAGESRQLVFNVTLEDAVDAPITVDFATAIGTADDGTGGGDSDFVATAGTLNFSGTAGEILQITVDLAEDTTVELDETMQVTLENLQAGGRAVTLAGTGSSSASNWIQIGTDIDGDAVGDHSGHSVSTSDDGSTLAIGAYGNDANGSNSGHVRIFQNVAGDWIQIGSDINGEAPGDNSGTSVSLSADGSTVAIGANFAGLTDEGHVRVFKNISGEWIQVGTDIDGEAAADQSGGSVSLSADGNILAIGATRNDGSGSTAGHVRVFQNLSGVWTQIGDDIDGEASSDQSGQSVSLSANGDVLAIGAHRNGGNGTGAGHVRIFQNVAGAWVQIGEDIDGEASPDESGYSVSLSADGATVAIGAHRNGGNGVNSGQVRVFENVAGDWVQIGEDIDGEAIADGSGKSVTLSADGNTLAVGARFNDGNGSSSGHVRVFRNVSGTWTQVGTDIDGKAEDDQSGHAVFISGDGNTVAIGATDNQANGENARHVRVYRLLPTGVTATGTITNDDSATISISDVSLAEGDSGTTSFDFVVTLSNPVDSAVTLTANSADGTALADEDFARLVASTITFDSLDVSESVSVQVSGDETVEPDEAFEVILSALQANGRAVSIADATGEGIIQSDDFNEPPTAVTLDNAVTSLVENTSTTADLFLATINITDDGNGTNAITLAGDDASFFKVVSTDLFLAAGAILDFENPADTGADNTFDLTIQVDDLTVGTTPDVTTGYTLSITDENEAPSFTSAVTANVIENGTSVLDASAIDPEGLTENGGGLTYAISGGADGSHFAIHAGTGTLTFQNPPDYENPTDDGSDNTYNVQIQVSDGTHNVAQDITVTVTNLNESPTDLTLSATSIVENTNTDLAPVAIGTLAAIDPEDNASTFTLVSGPGNTDNFRFEIVAAELRINQGETIDFESQSTYSIRINVTDGDNHFAKVFTLGVTDVNEAPQITSPSTANTPENQTFAIDLSATDPEGLGEGSGLTYSIVGGADQAEFTIDPTSGAVSFQNAPNFESPTDQGIDNNYEIKVQVTDGSNQTTQDLVITVTGVNEVPDPANMFADVPEIIADGTAVLQLAPNDPDSGDTHNFSITDGNTNDAFLIDPSGFLRVADSSGFTVGQTYNLTVAVRDQGGSGLTGTSVITIDITDVNTPPTGISLLDETSELAENTPVGSDILLAEISITDDGSGINGISLSGSDAGSFKVVGTQLFLNAGATLDFESPSDADGNNIYEITIEVDDPEVGTSPDATILYTLTIIDENEAPFFTSSSSVEIIENGSDVLDASAIDPEGLTENGGGLTYTISGGADQTLFDIDEGTGALTFQSPPDHEAPGDAGGDNIYDVQIQISDGTHQVAQDVSITVINQNESPTEIALDANLIAENTDTSLGSVLIGTLTATDPENNATTFTLVPGSGSADNSRFQIIAGELRMRQDQGIDFESQSTYAVRINVNDGNNDFAEEFTVVVTDQNDQLTATETVQNIGFTEDDPSVSIADIVIADQDTGERLTATLTLANSAAGSLTTSGAASYETGTGVWSITGSVGEVNTALASTAFQPTTDSASNTTITVSIADGGEHGTMPVTGTITLTATPVNDQPDFTHAGNQTVNEDAGAQSFAGFASFTPGGGADESTQTPTYLVSNDSTYLFSTQPWIDGGGNLSYTLADNANGTATVTVSVQDSGGLANGGDNTSPEQTFTIIINQIDDPANISGDTTGSGDEDAGDITGTLTAADTADGLTDGTIFTVTSGASKGSATIDPATGAWSYAPDANSNGPDSFTVTVTDDDGNTATQIISINVNQTDAPATIGGDVTGSGNEDAGDITGTLTATDAADGLTDGTIFTVTANPTNGSATIDPATGAWSYAPDEHFNGPDSFTVTITDDDGNTANQTISITVDQTDDPTTIGGDTTGSGDEDAGDITGTITAVDTIDGLTDGSIFTVTTDATNGTATIDPATGAWSYAPNANYNGPDSFTVTITDDDGNTATRSITTTVNQTDDPATIGGDIAGSGDEDASEITGTLTATDPADGLTNGTNFTVRSIQRRGELRRDGCFVI